MAWQIFAEGQAVGSGGASRTPWRPTGRSCTLPKFVEISTRRENRKAPERQTPRPLRPPSGEVPGELLLRRGELYPVNTSTSTRSFAGSSHVAVEPGYEHLNRPQRIRRVDQDRARGLKRCIRCLKLRSVDLYAQAMCRGKLSLIAPCLPCAASARYDITPDGYLKLLESQSGTCALCQWKPDRHQRLHVDHDHQTGRVRGLLCRGCNLGLGHFKDDAARLARAAAYIQAGEL